MSAVRSLLMAESPESFVRPSNLSPAKLDGMGMFCGDVDVRNGRGGEMWVIFLTALNNVCFRLMFIRVNVFLVFGFFEEERLKI